MTHSYDTTVIETLRPLLAAEAHAELPAADLDDLEQDVWLRLLEQLAAQDPPPDPAAWLTATVRAEARRLRRTSVHERPYATEPAADAGESDPELRALARERARDLHAAVRRLPGRCPRLIGALLSPQDPTYREIAGELGISQGSLGPERSRCLGCLRRIMASEVAPRAHRGKG
ncbi:sigma-70 family RNA polymerase sigma factor [Streptomyces sp. VRA16 Mangrove soil]|uniref:sigma-70 family RNA polymerase sigma factor n=1 Tax=Streptomyces sp. VRA16 Mangrove soil TaxID=2817434 RepID=UPI001A9DDC5B|nr:sigma-70 family RNA polymerase sigma factor [Streptomyces sp. VRA16 Mangrove soil]MBO1331688.1 sigma-70 family RNA polymerase sigma factor [Streptomyces sp. VRA16 Mangrove soil]